jgi:hypothetical protein
MSMRCTHGFQEGKTGIVIVSIKKLRGCGRDSNQNEMTSSSYFVLDTARSSTLMNVSIRSGVCELWSDMQTCQVFKNWDGEGA